jgi:aspartate oxidase
VTPALRGRMWAECGVVRDAATLERLAAGARHLVVRLTAQAALFRAESRGSHFRADFPAQNERFAGHVVHGPGSEPALERWL